MICPPHAPGLAPPPPAPGGARAPKRDGAALPAGLTRVAGHGLLLLALTTPADARQRPLSFEERVVAQEAIERVHYSHQIGATRPFEEAVPRGVLERKVRTYLKQSAALTEFWKTPVTSAAVERELERIAAKTRAPERLQELYAALGNDALVVQECLARAVLVDRLTRNFFAFDPEIHAAARAESDEIQRSLREGTLEFRAPHARRTVARLRRVAKGGAPPGREWEASGRAADDGRERPVDLEPAEFDRMRTRAPRQVGEAGPVVEGRQAFTIRVALEETDDSAAIAEYSVPKRTWDDWWGDVEGGLDEFSIRSGTGADPGLPVPAGLEESAQTACGPEDVWDNASLDDLPDARYYHTAVWTGSVMVVWGGDQVVGPFNSGGRYDPVTDTWAPTSTAGAPSGRLLHTAVWTGSQMVVWGGSGQGYLATGGRYDPVADTWTATSTIGAPAGRYYHTAVWTGSEMVVWGGSNGSYLDTGGRYDPATDTWTPTSTSRAPPGKVGHIAVWTGSRMVVWGGTYFDGAFHPQNTGGRYDPVADTWTPTSTAAAPDARTLPTAVWTGSQMIVWGGDGGSGGARLDSGGRYDPVNDVWAPTSTDGAPSARDSHTAVWTGSLMIVWGGSAQRYLSTGGRYDPVADTWTATSPTGADSGRYAHSAVWTGSLMIVWGGHGEGYLNTGGRYDPLTDSWTVTSTGGSPSPRTGETAIWTGSRMIVWGARDIGFGYLNTGGRYDPVTDSWTATSTAGAPSARADHTAVWTGQAMLVWGGYGQLGPGYVNTGGRYDPISDTWEATSTVDAPHGRIDHTAVWTGSMMVVWGGFFRKDDADHYLATGGRYDPVANIWRRTSPLDLKYRRTRHTAIWTGSEMLVWGGYYVTYSGEEPQYHYSAGGGRYDPVADTWTPTSIVGAPSGRHGHTAVWSGDRMIVWGGSPTTPFGFRYDPVGDAWAPVSTVGAPSARSAHTAVSTGSLMVVWGGYDGDYVNTGGRYDPIADTWTATSVAGAPAGRTGHVAVWTGESMLVWGAGFGQSSNGGRYLLSDHADRDLDGVPLCAGDCDDRNPLRHPGRAEACDALDNDCDQAVDGFATACGVGACGATGFCLAGVDTCAPGTPSAEACDGLDNDCDGAVPPVEMDADGDGARPCDGDCDDGEASTYPHAPEVNDGLDNQCAGEPGFGAVDEVSGIAGFTDPSDLARFCWPAQGAATSYQVVGSIGPAFAAGCQQKTTDQLCVRIDNAPPSTRAYYLLVRAAGPFVGSWGQGAAGAERAVPCVP